MPRRVFAYLRPHAGRLAIVIALSLVSTGLALWLPYLTKALVDDALIGRDLASLWRVVGLFAAASVTSFGLTVASGLVYTRVSADVLFDMRRDLYAHLQRLSPRFWATARLGDVVSRINNDISEIQRIASEIALAWVGNVLFLIGAVAVLVWLDGRLFLAGLATLPVAALALGRYRRLVEPRAAELRQRSADIGTFLIETLQGMRLVVTSNSQSREVGRFARVNDAFVGSLMRLQRVHYLAGGLPTALVGLGAAAVFVYGGWRVVEGTLSLGTLAAFMAYQARVVAPVQALMGLYGGLATARVSWRRVEELLNTPPEVVELADAESLADATGRIQFDGVSLTHGRGAAVLDDVSFIVGPGQTLAVAGASGSGKSTIADLIVRLIDPDAGAVRLDGHDLRTLRLHDVRRLVHIVDQDPVLFHGSIDDNVRYAAPDASAAEIEAALDDAGLSAFLAALPDHGRTVVGDRGLALSAGERQRVALARAFLARPAVLVLDEPSASLDPIAERHVIDSVRNRLRGRSVVVISHRLELVRAADLVIVIDGARVVERGAPAELAHAGGAYARLFSQPADATVQ